MSNPYVGEIRIFAGTFEPVDWMFCDGRLLPIAEFDALFNLIGTTYGGDGQSTFALPDLRGRAPVHMGSNAASSYVIGEGVGTETATLTIQNLPVHTHGFPATTAAASAAYSATNPPGNASIRLYAPPDPSTGTVAMSPYMSDPAAGGLPHDNMAPFLAVNYIISPFGIFPSRN